MTEQEMIRAAVALGFSAAAVADTRDIVFDPTFRPYCEENLCGKYGANYACPPDCGTPEEMKRRVLAHRKALVLQTIWDIPDYTDNAAIKKAKGQHNKISLDLMKQLRAEGVPGFMAGSGGCSLCRECARVRNEPCVFPDLMYSCMSAYCIFVKKLADTCGMEYTPGDGLIAFFGMYVFD